MQEVYYVYKAKKTGEFKLIADRNRHLTDIEVDVSIAHQENQPLGSIKWHKVVVNPLDPVAETPTKRDRPFKGGCQERWYKAVASNKQSAQRWQSLLTPMSMTV